MQFYGSGNFAEIVNYFFRCVVEDKNSKVAWLNRSGIIFAGHDKWSLDPRVELEKRHSLEYSLRIQKVDVYDEGSYTCSVQTQHEPKTSQVYLIVQGASDTCGKTKNHCCGNLSNQ
ncbi:hypothetical protein K5549_003571 [Capra hircus]|nr:hypothetical protein K5549_003571 [Capra hircus]